MRNRTMLLSTAAFSLTFLLLAAYTFIPRQIRSVSAAIDPAFTLVIDAGHGGMDGGAVSVSGRKESEINLEIAKKTEQLAALVGICPRMTRVEDISVHTLTDGSIAQKKASDLKNRLKMVRQTPNAILLSIHQNHFAEAKYYGAQVFYANTPHSKFFAERIQRDLQETAERTNTRQCKKSQGVYLMEHAPCTAVLVECGFLSNSAEELLLQQERYQKKLALAMLRTFAVYGNRGIENEI